MNSIIFEKHVGKALSIHDAKYIATYKYLMYISDRISRHEYVNAVAIGIE